MHIVIRAGGAGTRLWPLSTQDFPKQFYPMIAGKSTYELTLERIKPLLESSELLISTNKQFINHAKAQTEKLVTGKQPLFIIEPARKDTAAAIGLETVYAYKQDKQAIISSLGSDHVIQNADLFVEILRVAEQFISTHPEYLLEIGIKPTYAETGYGYIEMGERLEQIKNHEVYAVKKFKEKPEKDVAEQFVNAGTFLWNANMFVWKAETILKLFEQFQPVMYKKLMIIYEAIGTPQEQKVLEKEYQDIEKVAIDYAIIEKASNMAVISADIGWTDVGSFLALKDLLVKGDDNLMQGEHVEIDTKRSVIYGNSGKMIATIGLDNIAVIDTEKALLVCPLDRVQEIKKIVEQLEQKKLNKYL